MSETNREKEIFATAIEINDAEARANYIAAACGDDPALARRVGALLQAAGPAASFLPDSPAVTSSESGKPVAESAGSVVGRYKLLEQIGEGGFGIVFMAEQTEPVRRRVALKILKPGMDTRQVIARFESERQALALMSHPNIAQVLDGGATDLGRPFFVMELVRGVPITGFCREHRLAPEARLRLFLDVCAAVQHAHQKGIIHRDLKPSNILVTLHGDRPVPKIIDFGIAKAVGQPLTDRTVFTQFHQFLGTPAYTSPEQATLSGLDVDTRSDIYSLGVLLYELLTGTPPFKDEDLLSAGLDEMRRIIREQEPERPSTRLRRTGGNGLRDAARTPIRRSGFASDLDLIVLKTLEKEPDRRYATANGLAMDIRRYLANEPVTASPPSALYRFRKYCRRRRSEVVAAGVILALLIAGITVSTTLAVRARRAEQRAQAEAETSTAVAEFYWKDLLKQLSPADFTNRTVTLRQALQVAEKRAPIRLTNQPLAEATVSLAFGAAYTRLEDLERAHRHIRRAVDLRLKHLGEDDPRTLEAVLAISDNSQFREDAQGALTNFTWAHTLAKRILGPRHPDTIRAAIGEAWQRVPELSFADATNQLGRLAALAAEVRGPNDVYSRIALNFLALTLQDHGDLQEAERLLEESYRRALIDEGPEGGNALLCLSRLATVAALQGQFEKAERRFREVLPVRVSNYGPAHRITLLEFGNGLIRSVLLPQHRYAEALDEIELHIRRCLAEPETNGEWRSGLRSLLDEIGECLEATDALPIDGSVTLVSRLAGIRDSLGAR